MSAELPTGPGTLLGDLRAQLVDAAQRQEQEAQRSKQRRSRRFMFMAAAAVLLVVAGVVAISVVDRGSPVEAEVLEITQLEESIRVEIVDIDADPEAVARELRDAGLLIEVVSVPVSQGLVGTWVGWDSLGPVELLDGGDVGSRALEFAAGFQHTISLLYGRGANGDEPYLMSASEFMARGRFECSPLLFMNGLQAIEQLKEQGFTIVNTATIQPEGGIRDHSEVTPEMVLVDINSLSAKDLDLTFSLEAVPLEPRARICDS